MVESEQEKLYIWNDLLDQVVLILYDIMIYISMMRAPCVDGELTLCKRGALLFSPCVKIR